MKIELRKWGNSIGLRIPLKIAQSMGLNENSTIEMIQSGESLIIKKKEEIDLDELIGSIPDDFEYPEDVRDFVYQKVIVFAYVNCIYMNKYARRKTFSQSTGPTFYQSEHLISDVIGLIPDGNISAFDDLFD